MKRRENSKSFRSERRKGKPSLSKKKKKGFGWGGGVFWFGKGDWAREWGGQHSIGQGASQLSKGRQKRNRARRATSKKRRHWG